VKLRLLVRLNANDKSLYLIVVDGRLRGLGRSGYGDDGKQC
jgi:hypothetical protein